MKSLISIVARNLKIIYRSKLSFLLVLLAPILIVFLVGTAFSSSSLSDINIAVYSESYSDLTYDISNGLKESNYLINYKDSEDLCITAVKQGNSHACVSFPANMSLEGNNESVLMYVDNSRLNLAYILVNQIEEEISSKGSELGIAMADDLLEVISDVKNSLPEQKINLDDIKEEFSSISSGAGGISVSSGIVSNLNDAIDEIETVEIGGVDLSDAKSEINSAKSLLEDLEDEIDDNIGDIKSDALSGKSIVNENIEEIDKLIVRINSITSDSAEDIVTPIKTEVVPLKNGDSNWKKMFPTLIALVILLSSVVLASSLVLTERRAKARFRNFLTPTSDFTFIFATYITGFIILALQMIIFFTGTYYLTELSILDNIWHVVLVLFLTTSVFLFLGMFIGYLFKSDETTILVSISVASLMIFFSNTIVPMESISGVLRYFAMYNPLSISDALLKKIILFAEPLNTMYIDLGIIAGMAIVFMVLTLFARKMTKRWA